MTTNNTGFNPNISAHDLASFEPEAILATLPGEHPRMAGALAIGREASETGHLDVAALSRIANELYAEGFPAGAFAGNSTATPVQIPATDSLTVDVDRHLQLSPNQSAGSGFDFKKLPASLPYDVLNIDGLLANNEQLYQHPIDDLLVKNIPHAGFSGVSSQPQAGANSPYYFLQQIGLPNQSDSAFTPNDIEAVGIQNGVYQKPLSSQNHPAFSAEIVRKDFPILQTKVNGYPLIWLDNAATTQKPQAVIDRISHFYQHENSNIHRAAHELAARATDAYEEARETVRRFINAPSVDQIIFVRGTTEAINLVAKTYGKKHLSSGDEIVISHLEHHANIVPWQQLCQETGAVLKVIPVDDTGQILLNEYQQLLTSKVKLVSFTQVSNALGTVTPAQQMIQMAHRVGAKVLLDGAQSISHMPTDVQALDADFFVFSGHKVFGPTGIGVLYGKPEILAEMPAWQGGGNMIQDVTFDKTVYHAAPAKFEAGTGNIADAVGLGAALQYVERIGIHNIARYEHELLVYAMAQLGKIKGLRLIGTAAEKASVLSFTLAGYKSEEVGAALNAKGIAVRSGHHCAQPILRRFGVETTVRPSLAFYNTYAEVDFLVKAILTLVH